MKKVSFYFLFLILFLLLNCRKVINEKIITVSILPQKYFVERIVGDKFKINVMVGPGREPHDYEPLPGQMIELSRSALYLSIGVPFEKIWLKKIAGANPEMKIVQTQDGIALRQFGDDEKDSDEEGSDTHIWLSPKLVEIQCQNIYNAVVSIDPDNEKLYKKNLDDILNELDELSEKLSNAFDKANIREFIVFHPAWGYFADEFGLKQIAIEIEGKEPAPKQIAEIIETAKEKKIKVVFVQKQFSGNSAKAIAEEIKGSIVFIDPLSEDYINNLNNVAETIINSMK